MLTVAIVVSALCPCEDVHPAEERVVVDPTPQHTNLSPLVAGLTIRLSSSRAKVRRGGYRKSISRGVPAAHWRDTILCVGPGPRRPTAPGAGHHLSARTSQTAHDTANLTTARSGEGQSPEPQPA